LNSDSYWNLKEKITVYFGALYSSLLGMKYFDSKVDYQSTSVDYLRLKRKVIALFLYSKFFLLFCG